MLKPETIMNNGLLKIYFKRLAVQVLNIFKSHCPVDTGFLQNSIRLEFTQTGWNIIIDVPYMVYTNEQWLSERWNGAENPNLYWFNEAFAEAHDYINNAIRGTEDIETKTLTVGSEAVDQYQKEKGYI